MNYLSIDNFSVVDGIGIRAVLWVSGCTCHCPQCHNPETWDFNAGHLFDEQAKERLFDVLNKPYIQGVTLSGGHPFEKQNRAEVASLCAEIKKKFPNKDMWAYTGYTWEEIFGDESYKEVQQSLRYIDVLVDGKFVPELKDLTLKWRGSSNQRVIDVQKSLNANEIVLYCD